MVNILSPTHLWPFATFSSEGKWYIACAMVSQGTRSIDCGYFDQVTEGSHENVVCHGKWQGGITLVSTPIVGAENVWGSSIADKYRRYGDNLTGIVGDCIITCRDGVPLTDPPAQYVLITEVVDGLAVTLLYYGCVSGRPEENPKRVLYTQLRGCYCFSVRDGLVYKRTVNSPSMYYEPFENDVVSYGSYPAASFGDASARWRNALRAAIADSPLTPVRTRDYPYLYHGKSTASYDSNRLPNIMNQFRFNEPKNCRIGFGMREDYAFQHLRQSAFMSAIDGVKTLNQNSVSTLIEVIQFLLKLRSGKFRIPDILPSSLSEAWLSYRYVYHTTKMDFKEACEFVNFTGVFDISENFFMRGSAYYNDVECRCKVNLKSRFLSGIKECWSALYKYGLQPNFYVVWDMTPFSFIVDWFLPVGELCSIIDSYNYLSDAYDCINVVYSLKYSYQSGNDHMMLNSSCYTRWVESRFPSVEFSYLHCDDRPADKTILFRCIDAVSLIMGRK